MHDDPMITVAGAAPPTYRDGRIETAECPYGRDPKREHLFAPNGGAYVAGVMMERSTCRQCGEGRLRASVRDRIPQRTLSSVVPTLGLNRATRRALVKQMRRAR